MLTWPHLFLSWFFVVELGALLLDLVVDHLEVIYLSLKKAFKSLGFSA